MKLKGGKFELPQKIEDYLAILSALYAQEGERKKQEIIVNARITVREEWSADGWNGGTYGHALFLALPESLYVSIVRNKDHLQIQIKGDLNKIHNVQNEFIEEVFLEMQSSQEKDWRKESGLLAFGARTVLPDAEKRIWGDDGYRLFLSHKTEAKVEAAELKKKLRAFGVSCFVAHEDIQPTQQWQNEIEAALSSMDAVVALMTEKFHDSFWTDQELGFAFGRGVPIVALRLGRDPYGFIGKFQALSCPLEAAPQSIVKLLIKHNRLIDAYITAIQTCRSFDAGNLLAEVLPGIEKLSDEQAKKLVEAYNNNSEVRGSFGFNGAKPRAYGDGLIVHLERTTGKKYRFSKSSEIEIS